MGVIGAAAVADLFWLDARPAHAAPFPITNWWGAIPPYNHDYQDHVARGSGNPGVDWGMPQGSSLKAPHEGQLSIAQSLAPGALWQANIVHPTGWRSELLHVSGFVGAARYVALGDVVALSGGLPGAPGSGAGLSDGAHLHWSLKMPSGANVDPLLHVNSGLAITHNGGDSEMLLLRLGTGAIGASTTFGLFGPGFWWEFTESSPWDVGNGVLKQIAPPSGVPAIAVTQAQWDAVKAAAQATRTVQVVS